MLERTILAAFTRTVCWGQTCWRSMFLFEAPFSPWRAPYLDSHSWLICFVPFTQSSNIYPAPPTGSMGQTLGRLQRRRGHGSSSQGALILNLMENQNNWLWEVVHESVQMNVIVRKWNRAWKTRLRKTFLSFFFTLTWLPCLTSDTRHVGFPHIKQFSDTRWVSYRSIQFWH